MTVKRTLLDAMKKFISKELISLLNLIPSKESLTAIRALIDKGLSIREIAETLDWSQESVRFLVEWIQKHRKG